jgi:hypothetical protein
MGACPFCLDTRRDSREVDTVIQSDAPCCSQVMAIEQIRDVPRIACPFRHFPLGVDRSRRGLRWSV